LIERDDFMRYVTFFAYRFAKIETTNKKIYLTDLH